MSHTPGEPSAREQNLQAAYDWLHSEHCRTSAVAEQFITELQGQVADLRVACEALVNRLERWESGHDGVGRCPACGEIIADVWGESYHYARRADCPWCLRVLHIVSIGHSLYGLGLPEETTSEVVARYVRLGVLEKDK